MVLLQFFRNSVILRWKPASRKFSKSSPAERRKPNHILQPIYSTTWEFTSGSFWFLEESHVYVESSIRFVQLAPTGSRTQLNFIQHWTCLKENREKLVGFYCDQPARIVICQGHEALGFAKIGRRSVVASLHQRSSVITMILLCSRWLVSLQASLSSWYNCPWFAENCKP